MILAVVLLAGRTAPALAETDIDREYKVKAAFLLNFIKFVDGGRFNPHDGADPGADEPNGPIVVAVLGTPPSTEAFAELAGRQVRDRSVVVRQFKGFDELKSEQGKIPELHPDMEQIKKCHVLFLCPAEKPFVRQTLATLRTEGILTVADVPGFLQAGGVINFVIEEKKVRFEVNLAAAARAKLQVRSSLLRLAIKIVEHDEWDRQDGERS